VRQPGKTAGQGSTQRALVAAGQLLGTLAVGVLGGHWLDGLLHTTPWLTVAGVLVGFVGGIVAAYRALFGP
jgi:F0F1-type ATP synthase assembly protein I